MSLKNYQTELSLNTLYEVSVSSGFDWNDQQANPSIWINSGAVNIYTSQSATKPTSISQMTLDAEETNVKGLAVCSIADNVIPRYIAIVQSSGTSTEIISTGLTLANFGGLS